MKKYELTNSFRCNITHVIEANNENEAKQIACDREYNFTKDQILSNGLEFCNTVIKELNMKTIYVKYSPCKFYEHRKIYGSSEWIFTDSEGKIYKKNVSTKLSETEDIFTKGIKLGCLELGLSYQKLKTFRKVNDREYIFIYE